jgi:hypothetical protein
VGVDLETNKLLLFIVARNVGDNEDEVKLVKMLGDSLGVSFVAKSSNVEVENKRQNLKFYGGFKGAISTTMITNLIGKKKIVTLDVLQSFHNKSLSKKPKERLINIQVENTNLMKHF